MKLQDIQDSFQAHIIRRDNVIEDNFSHLYKTGHVPLEDRLKVYRDNIVGGLAANLIETFPTIKALCGADFTLSLLRSYIRENLPQSGCLEDYGADIADFIEEFPPAAPLPYLGDMARFDWAMSACEYAADDQAMQPRELQSITDMDHATLNLRSSVHLVSSKFPILKIRHYAHDPHHHRKDPPSLESGPEYVMVYRPYLKAEYVALTKEEFVFLSGIQKGQNIQKILGTLLSEYPTFDFAAFLQKFFGLQVFKSKNL